MPDLEDGVGDDVRFVLLPPIFRNLLSSDIDPCLEPIVAELSSCRWSLWPPKIWECRFSESDLTSTALLDDRGRLTDEELGLRFLALSALNLNLCSTLLRFLGCGARLCAAYGSSSSPAGVKGLV